MKQQPIKDFAKDVARYFGCYTTIYNYKFDQGHDLLLQRILQRGRPVDFDGNFRIVFELDGRYVAVWCTNRWYAYASRINEMKQLTNGDWGYKNEADYLTVLTERGKRPRRKTLILFDRMVSLYREAQQENVSKIIDVEG